MKGSGPSGPQPYIGGRDVPLDTQEGIWYDLTDARG